MKKEYRIPEAETILVDVDIVTASILEDVDNIVYLPNLPGWPGKI